MDSDDADGLLFPFERFESRKAALACAKDLAQTYKIQVLVRGTAVLIPEHSQEHGGFRAVWEMIERRRGTWDEAQIQDYRNPSDEAHAWAHQKQREYERTSEEEIEAYQRETLERSWDDPSNQRDDI